MKKIKKLKGINKIYIVVPLIVFLSLFLIVLGVYSITLKNKKYDENNYNFYRIVPGDKKLKDENTITSDKLSYPHCINDLCVENVIVHSGNSIGRVDYTVRNKSNETLNGYLKLVFNDRNVIIFYNVDGNSTFKSVAQYNGFTIENVDDYSLEYLNDKDLQLITVN